MEACTINECCNEFLLGAERCYYQQDCTEKVVRILAGSKKAMFIGFLDNNEPCPLYDGEPIAWIKVAVVSRSLVSSRQPKFLSAVVNRSPCQQSSNEVLVSSRQPKSSSAIVSRSPCHLSAELTAVSRKRLSKMPMETRLYDSSDRIWSLLVLVFLSMSAL